MSIFSKLKETYISASLRIGKAQARQELLRMSDRQLQDFGFSKELLLQGVNAWPWRVEEDTVDATQLPVMTAAQKKASYSKHEIKQAISELSSYSDRELAELGVARNSIEDVVRYGRSTIDGTFDSHKHAA